jgi:predicted nucleic acid-binding protein
VTEGLADTSVWISAELGRRLGRTGLPDVLLVSVITLAELQAGVLAASDPATVSTRLRTLQLALESEPLPVDAAVAQEWALLRVEVARAGRRVNVNDLWIAATARANRLQVVTQDGDFAALAALGLIDLIEI